MTDFIDIADMLAQIMEVAPACPEPTAVSHLRNAAIRFCRVARIWRSSDSFTAKPTNSGAEFSVAPDDAAIAEFTLALFEDEPLNPRTIRDLDVERPLWRTETGTPYEITEVDWGTVRIVPIPEDEGTLSLQLVLEPASEAVTLPDFLNAQWLPALSSGALSTLLLIPDKPFTNPNLAAIHAGTFNEALATAKWHGAAGQVGARQRTKPSWL